MGGGGDWRAFAGSPIGEISTSAPRTDSASTPIGWKVTVSNRGAPGTTLEAFAYVICAAP